MLGAGGESHRWRIRRAGQQPPRGGSRDGVGRRILRQAWRRRTWGLFPLAEGFRGVLEAGRLIVTILSTYSACHSK